MVRKFLHIAAIATALTLVSAAVASARPVAAPVTEADLQRIVGRAAVDAHVRARADARGKTHRCVQVRYGRFRCRFWLQEGWWQRVRIDLKFRRAKISSYRVVLDTRRINPPDRLAGSADTESLSRDVAGPSSVVYRYVRPGGNYVVHRRRGSSCWWSSVVDGTPAATCVSYAESLADAQEVANDTGQPVDVVIY